MRLTHVPVGSLCLSSVFCRFPGFLLCRFGEPFLEDGIGRHPLHVVALMWSFRVADGLGPVSLSPLTLNGESR